MTTFVDTGFPLALSLKSDSLHERALAWELVLPGKCLTTEFVLLELADALCSPDLRATAQSAIDRIRQDPYIEIIPASTTIIELGYALFCQRKDKAWSLTDCISFEIMRAHGITDALTHDHHFEQAGFRALLRTEPPSN